MAVDRRIEKATTVLLVATVMLHHSYAPYTKVEESFNIQATHDVLTYGLSFNNATGFLKKNYDHIEFPGSVPRTFVGPLVLAGLTKLSQVVATVDSAESLQSLVRGILGLANAACLVGLRNAVSHTFGTTAATWYMILQTSQFHVMYYASRTLPNMFAFALATYAFRDFVYGLSADHGKANAWYRQSLMLFTFAGVVFRAEIAVLLASVAAFLIGINRSSLTTIVIPGGLMGGIPGLAATLLIDSYFWQQFPMWPELQGFYYNTILGKSSDWGVSPREYYIVDSVPKLLLNPITWLFLIPLAIYQPSTRSRALALILPAAGFVFVYSILPHKEWRFIIYIIPALTCVASIGASWIWTRRAKSFLYRILAASVVVSVLGSYAASGGLLAISRFNYPGGVAVTHLRELAKDDRGTVKVYADNLTCQTGLTRFLEDRTEQTAGHARWAFDKTDNESRLLDPVFWEQFDYVITEQPGRAIGKWVVVDVVRAYSGIRIVQPGRMLDTRTFAERMEGGKIMPLEPWEQTWMDFGNRMRGFTKGWWIVVKMEPRLRILKRQRTPINTVIEEA